MAPESAGFRTTAVSSGYFFTISVTFSSDVGIALEHPIGKQRSSNGLIRWFNSLGRGYPISRSMMIYGSVAKSGSFVCSASQYSGIFWRPTKIFKHLVSTNQMWPTDGKRFKKLFNTNDWYTNIHPNLCTNQSCHQLCLSVLPAQWRDRSTPSLASKLRQWATSLNRESAGRIVFIYIQICIQYNYTYNHIHTYVCIYIYMVAFLWERDPRCYKFV